MAGRARFNPFPGLRPFKPDEDHLFFGRERQTDELLRRLRLNRFVAVVGLSGCGKSSLVQCGLIPSLESGSMIGAGASWHVVTMHPGDDPIGQLAGALNTPGVLAVDDPEAADRTQTMINVTLRRGARGLVEAVGQARFPSGDNVLVIVDQFEELFRFRRSRQLEDSRDDAIAFVKLLLEAAAQTDPPIYIALTMRSDYIGDCMAYPGLPEAVSDGQYLVPRLTRDELRLAITGPIAVAGGSIAPRLVQRLLNDFGDDPDSLPVLQHALMRTWEHAERSDAPDAPIDMADYEAIGTMQHALSLHADEAYSEAVAKSDARVVARLFKALTDTFLDPRGVRRPATIEELTAVTEAHESAVMSVVDTFRESGRSFLTPDSKEPLTPHSIVDLSHESLMRRWTRLIEWTNEEAIAAAFYLRLSQAAAWFEQGTAALWRNPELELAARWKQDTAPTPTWASRYNDAFERAMRFLAQSQTAWEIEQAERERTHRRQLVRTRIAAGLLGATALVAVGFAMEASRASGYASTESERANQNLRYATDAVGSTLAAAGLNLAQPGLADSPDLHAFKATLLADAQAFYTNFVPQDKGEQTQAAVAQRALDLGHIHRMMGRDHTTDATTAYKKAIASFDNLYATFHKPEYQEKEAVAHTWLGETLRDGPSSGWQEAKTNYDRALTMLGDLRRAPASQRTPVYTQEFARALYNRSLVLNKLSQQAAAQPSTAQQATADEAAAEQDARQAIALLEPLQNATLDQPPGLDLARAYNNLATMIQGHPEQLAAAQELYGKAVSAAQIVTSKESNPENQFELATFENNLGAFLIYQKQQKQAVRSSNDAVTKLGDLRRPSITVGFEALKAHVVRGEILDASTPGAGTADYREAVGLLAQVAPVLRQEDLEGPHWYWVGRLMVDLAALSHRFPNAGALLDQALASYVDVNLRLAGVAGTDPATVSQDLKAATDFITTTIAGSVPPAQRSQIMGFAAKLGSATPVRRHN
jgi:tetratricopeptide (TPR) repeat protein